MTSGKPKSDRAEEEVFIFPASFAQQRLWFIDRLVPGVAIYNVPLVFRLAGKLDRSALEQSFEQIVSRHEVLRTTFDVIDGQLVQAIAPSLQITLPLIDLQSLPEASRQPEAIAQIRQDMQQPFDLVAGPLLRLGLWQLGETEYLMLINLHHIIFDEWSSGVLIRELGALYSAIAQGKPAILAELPIQYGDFAHWQRQWLQGETLQQQLSYWQQQLKAIPILELPSDAPRAAQQSNRGAIQLLELPQSLLTALEDLSQQAGVTLFMTLLAAFQTLLYRYTEQTDIVVGSPIANRNRKELEDLIGFFVNSLVLRTDLSGNPSFRELLERVKEVALAAYAHQDIPFEKLVEELQPIRSLGKNPLFQVVFALQNTPMEQLNLPGLTLSSVEFETQTTRFDLELYLWKSTDNFRSLWGKGWQKSDGLRGVIVYNADLFEAETITRLRQHFQILLEGIVANPNSKLAEFPLLTAIEQQQLQEWNNTQTDYPADCCIHQLFEQQVRQHPEAIALQFADKIFTYQELNCGSNQLARYLQRLGIGTETRVGMGLEQSPEAIAVMLAILKVGGAYVPLDPSYPPERLNFILDDAQISVVVTQSRWSDRFEASHAKILDLEQVWSAIASEDDRNLTCTGNSNQLAYAIYTSGSTGTPKGVAIPHRAVNRLVRSTNYIQIEKGDRLAQVANLAFDAATFEIWGALLNGAQLIEIAREVALSPRQFVTQLQQQQISILFLTTALFNQIVSEIPDGLRSLKYLLFGGEIVDLQRVRQVLQFGKPQHLLHVYGPTENTTFSTWYEVETISDDATTIPIGSAIANTQVYLLDNHLNPVPIGVSGEIYLAGEGLAQGYLNRPELTAERFLGSRGSRGGTGGTAESINNEQSTMNYEHSALSTFNSALISNSKLKTQNSKLYKTGDRARFRKDGNLEFLGRTDDQIKIRGFRVELGEIEQVLSQHPDVREAIALLREIEGNQQLVAYLVPHSSFAFIERELRDFLKSKLPAYMVPSIFVTLEKLPLTPNGKVNRRALPLPSLTAKIEAPVAPRTSVEAALTDIWHQLLGQKPISIDDNFFELGGHSLLATQLISRIRDRLSVEVPLRCLFEFPTIGELAQQIEMARTRIENLPAQVREEVEL